MPNIVDHEGFKGASEPPSLINKFVHEHLGEQIQTLMEVLSA